MGVLKWTAKQVWSHMAKPKRYDVIRERFFVCACGDEGEERCNALRREVMTRLNVGRTRKNQVTDKNLLSNVVYALAWNFDATIQMIPCDQWCAVHAERSVYQGVYPNGERVVTDNVAIQCDRVEDGVAAVWKYFADKYESTGEVT